MNENKNIQLKEEAPQTQEGAKAAGNSLTWRRLMAKKWAFPAIYMAAAAIILTLMWVYQGAGKNALSDDQVGLTTEKAGQPAATGKDSVATSAQSEQFQWPVLNRSELEVSLPYFDSKASAEAKQEAMLEYDGTFTPHVGLDLAREDNQPFDVLAAAGGKVTAVDKNAIAGSLVEITHSNGLVSVYQSLTDVKVTKGAEVKRGDVIAKAGRNELEKDEGIHLHFEVRQGEDGGVVNPETLLPNP
ncbi:M23 family metallopeptidase [Paenibacillus aurantius]|uniref:M23 family metallopeptidase n=1 Tax=Paenibacillus aurantius TaxID=2918900 RepID=A0AA96LD62_9BACL|nr:M23 family metallopeptidase [Paenibacillus aurantius]WJH36287.1 M23 family metallopeptidase [Paenibacillus sp. CC-CFT747]WNQ11572.1 M23 family metallopeptidase [Paenibacillus aurantius]